MPTGYTSDISKGISFEEFALNCAKAFGACVTMRDEPNDKKIPDEFKPSDYHSKAIVEAEKRYKKLKSISIEQAEKEAIKMFKAVQKQYNKWDKDKTELKEKYELMLSKVRAWTPPSNDHKEYKNFMIKQIEGSIEFDCSFYPRDFKLLTGENWLKKEIDEALYDINYHTKKDAEERKRVAKRNIWIKQLRQSLIKPN